MTRAEIVADLQHVPGTVAADVFNRWVAADPSTHLLHRATFALPPEALPLLGPIPAGWRIVSTRPAAGFWSDVLRTAGHGSGAVLALLNPVMPGIEAAGLMSDLLDTDPMFGAAIARVQCWDGCCVQSLPERNGHEPEWLPSDTVAELRPYEMIGDALAPCSMLKPVLLTEFGDRDPGMVSLAGALFYRIASGRRCGFRTVVANRAAVAVAGCDCRLPPSAITLPDGDRNYSRAFDNDGDREWNEFRSGSATLFERLTGRHITAVRGRGRPSLLLDIRNVGATYNGTTFAALGASRGLHQSNADWDVSILANPDGAEFHDFASMFPGWTVYTSTPPAGYNIALRLSQPWHIQEMIDLHRLARLNAYLMLDTICWDVIYVAPPNLDGTWRFLAGSADSLMFISDYSRRRFRARFPDPPHSPDVVCHLSFDPDDYTRPEALDAQQSDYFLVIGNHLAHKDVAATADLLASAFPLTRIETLGPTYGRSPRVTAHKSGTLADLEIQRLYAGARLAIFPSFYEGFGLPVVTALAYGRTLLARESDLLTEVADLCVPRGRLLTYRERDELVEHIGRLTHDEPVPEYPLGAALNGSRPRSWRDVGVQIGQSLRQLMTTASNDAWRARDSLISQVVAYK